MTENDPRRGPTQRGTRSEAPKPPPNSPPAARDVRLLRLDVTDADSVKSAAAWIEETFGRLDVLVNNAGISIENRAPVTEVTADQMRRTYETTSSGSSPSPIRCFPSCVAPEAPGSSTSPACSAR